MNLDAEITSALEKMNQPESSAPQASVSVPAEPLAPAVETKPASPVEQSYEINYKGDKRKLSYSQLVEFAQKGTDYEIKMSEIRREREAIDKARKSFDPNRYKEIEDIDTYYRKHPEEWQAIVNSYNSREIPQDAEPYVKPFAEKISSLEKELNSLKSKLDERENVELEKQAYAQLSNVKNRYAYLDWKGIDSEGLVLEDKILKFATDRGIDNLTTATLEYCSDEIEKNLIEEGKRKALEEVKKNAQAGIVNIQRTPGTPQPPKKIEVKGKSYQDIINEALKSNYGG